MISIKKDFGNPPKKLADSNRNTQILDALTFKNEHKFKSSIYRNTTIEALEELYHHKCAYCETDTSAGAPFQVEHFRPKAKIEDDSTHKGYYWMAYEWSNLTLGCSSCNNAKRNHFPINGTRVNDPLLGADGLPENLYLQLNSDIFKNEEAILLNPEIDIVEKHFIFTPDGKIVGLDDRGRITIEKLKLNRKRLIFWRKKLIDDYSNEFKTILDDFISNTINIEQCRYAIKQVLTRVALLQEPQKHYSRFGFFMFTKFDIFFSNQLEEKQKIALTKFFELFRKNEL
jgi:uncharacterized protein (TIGR02646 family)